MADRIDELLSRLVPLKGPDVPTPPVRYRSDDPSSSQALSPLPPARYEQPEWNEDSEVRLNVSPDAHAFDAVRATENRKFPEVDASKTEI